MKTRQLKLVAFVQRKLFKYYKYKFSCKLKTLKILVICCYRNFRKGIETQKNETTNLT